MKADQLAALHNCRHVRANMKMFGKGQSWEWCGMCGALRQLNPTPLVSKWLIPKLLQVKHNQKTQWNNPREGALK